MIRGSARLTVPAVLAVVLAHYLWTASSTGNAFRFGVRHEDPYNRLCDALLAGQLSLLVTPRPELLRLADPYDPRANDPFKIWDYSLYRGRYYLYFGVAPALAAFLPFRMLTGMDLPENLAAALFMFGGVLSSLAAFLIVAGRFLPRTPLHLVASAAVLLGFSNFGPYILRRPAVYEVAVAAGYCFLMSGLACTLWGVLGARGRALGLAAGSLSFGLAVASRPHLLMAAPFLLAAYTHLGARQPGGWRRNWREALWLALPFATCLAGLLLYNRARFGEWLEFGSRYVLSGVNQPKARLFSGSYLPFNAFVLFFAPPTIGPEFPFFRLMPSYLPRFATRPLVLESIAGLFSCVPVAALSLLSPLLLTRPLAQRVGPAYAVHASTFAALGLAVAAPIGCYAGISARYLADYGPLFLLSALLTWAALDHATRARPLPRIALNGVLILLLAWGTLLNLAVGLTGPYDLLRKRRPATYQAIEDRFLPLQRLWLSIGLPRSGGLSIRFRAPASRSTGPEALLATGDRTHHSDVLCFRYAGDGRAMLGFHHKDAGWLSAVSRRSRPIELPPGTVHTLEITMGSLLPPVNTRVLNRLLPGVDVDRALSRLSVNVDGEEVLSGRFEFTPAPAGSLTLGRNPVATEHCPSDFSGEVLEVKGMLP